MIAVSSYIIAKRLLQSYCVTVSSYIIVLALREIASLSNSYILYFAITFALNGIHCLILGVQGDTVHLILWGAVL